MWPGTPDELAVLQRELAAASPPEWRVGDRTPTIGACVVCFARGQTGAGARGDPAWAAAATMRDYRLIARATVRGEAGAGYLPGSLALREGPTLEAAVRALSGRPDVLLVDATGHDHPRRAGLALHLGAVLDLPTVGVTHRPLLATGTWPAEADGATTPLVLDEEIVGAWLRTRADTRPLAVHPAWRTDLATAIAVVRHATAAHRTPEPFRHARMLARTARTRWCVESARVGSRCDCRGASG